MFYRSSYRRIVLDILNSLKRFLYLSYQVATCLYADHNFEDEENLQDENTPLDVLCFYVFYSSSSYWRIILTYSIVRSSCYIYHSCTCLQYTLLFEDVVHLPSEDITYETRSQIVLLRLVFQ